MEVATQDRNGWEKSGHVAYYYYSLLRQKAAQTLQMSHTINRIIFKTIE